MSALSAIIAGGIMLAPAASASQYGCEGYSVIAHSIFERNSGTKLSNVIVYYDPATGVNCVVNRRTALGEFGKKAWLEVSVWADGGSVFTDAGNFSQMAGPVSVRAPGKCINVKAITHTASGGYGDLSFRGACG
ncbi:hypothetical protein ACSHWO_18730 [Streptomyces sp. HUAS TT3]|uniref:hypothetical protein n=1 Tax=Streptomyces sp. HUAS TT3 TaxID=3447510 RepID=UPI003F65E94B